MRYKLKPLIMKSFFVSGLNVVASIIKNKKRDIKNLYISKNNSEIERMAKENNVKVIFTSLKKINSFFKERETNHQNIALEIALSPKKKVEDIDTNEVVILDNITDPRNLGSIIRSCAAFSIKDVIIEKGSIDTKSNALFRSSAGYLELVNLIEVTNIKHAIKFLKSKDFWISGMINNEENNIYNFNWPDKNAFVLGSEGEGIRQSIIKYLDFKLEIPISKEVESLNVSNAATALLTIFSSKKNPPIKI